MNMNDGTEIDTCDTLGAMMAWDNGELDEDSVFELFQRLVDNGWAWTLQGCYGRQAIALIQAGFVTRQSWTS